jgi:hypothetical protein
MVPISPIIIIIIIIIIIKWFMTTPVFLYDVVRASGSYRKKNFIEQGSDNLTDYKKITGHYVNVTGPSSVCQWTKLLQLLVYIYFADQRHGPDLRTSSLYTSQWGHM